MELIKKLGTRRSSPEKAKQSWGLFVCPYCTTEIERNLGSGKRDSSCGCYTYAARTTHGLSRGDGGKTHPLYDLWRAIHKRCYSPQYKCAYRYGGRGIKVCDEWHNSETFIAWALVNGWRQGLQIDRRNNDGDYEPSNCHFVTSAENNRNQSTTKLTDVAVRGIKELLQQGGNTYKKVGEIGEMFGVSRTTIYDIMAGRTWNGIE
jgi:hypothetical protein